MAHLDSLAARYALAASRARRSDEHLIALINRLAEVGAPQGAEKEILSAITYLSARSRAAESSNLPH